MSVQELEADGPMWKEKRFSMSMRFLQRLPQQKSRALGFNGFRTV